MSPTTVAFGSRAASTISTTETATLTNAGNATLSLSSIQVTGPNPGDFSSTNSCGSSVAAGANCTISVTFQPTVTGTRTAAVTVTAKPPATPRA